MVRSRYAAAATASCCRGAEAENQGKSREIGYSEDEITAAGEGANLGLGCGNPQAIAGLGAGEVVASWAPGRGTEDYIVSANITAEKPRA